MSIVQQVIKVTLQKAASPPHVEVFSVLYNDLPLFPSKLPLFMGSGPQSNTWFLGPTRVHNPNGISIGSSVVAGLTIVTDRDGQTDRQHYIGNRPRLRT